MNSSRIGGKIIVTLLRSAMLWNCSLLLVACVVYSSSSTSRATPVGAGITIRPGDLPSGWVPIGPVPLERVGQDVLVWQAAYASADDPTRSTITIQQQLTVFSTTQSATDAYGQWDRKWFPTTDWLTPQGTQFTPRDPDGQHHYACVCVAGASILACGQLQRHVNLVSLVIANIDGHSMTLAQFGQVIDHIDARLTLVP